MAEQLPTLNYSKQLEAEVKDFLVPIDSLSTNKSKEIIQNYYVAFHENFLRWMNAAETYSNSSEAKEIIRENIECEISQNHPKLLRDFTTSCGLRGAYYDSNQNLNRIIENIDHNIFTRKIGLEALSFIQALENTSLIFIPYLTDLGSELGSENSKYLHIHGYADIEHAKELNSALNYEVNYLIKNPESLESRFELGGSKIEDVVLSEINCGTNHARKLLDRIFSI